MIRMRSISKLNLASSTSRLNLASSTTIRAKAKASTVTLTTNAGATPSKRKRSSVHLPSAPNGAPLPAATSEKITDEDKMPEAKKTRRMSYLGSLADAGRSLLSLGEGEKGSAERSVKKAKPKRRSSLLPGKSTTGNPRKIRLGGRWLQIQIWMVEQKKEDHPGYYPVQSSNIPSAHHAPQDIRLCASKPTCPQTCVRPKRLFEQEYHFYPSAYFLHFPDYRSKATTGFIIRPDNVICIHRPIHFSIPDPRPRAWSSHLRLHYFVSR
jgi:hypothetical protein